MEKIEVIEEKKMIKRMLGKFFSYIMMYGLIYAGAMVFFFMFLIFQEETKITLITMCLVNVAVNLGIMMLLGNKAILETFNGIDTVNVPSKSRKRILRIAGTVLAVLMVVITYTDIISFHTLFKSKIDVSTYTVSQGTPIDGIKINSSEKSVTLSRAEITKNNKLYVTAKTYSTEAIEIIASIILLNALIVIGAIGYENKLLKRCLGA